MHTRVRVHNIAQMTDRQSEGHILERLLHGAATKETQVAACLSAAAIRLLGSLWMEMKRKTLLADQLIRRIENSVKFGKSHQKL